MNEDVIAFYVPGHGKLESGNAEDLGHGRVRRDQPVLQVLRGNAFHCGKNGADVMDRNFRRFRSILVPEASFF
jgi:hypothetical protein